MVFGSGKSKRQNSQTRKRRRGQQQAWSAPDAVPTDVGISFSRSGRRGKWYKSLVWTNVVTLPLVALVAFSYFNLTTQYLNLVKETQAAAQATAPAPVHAAASRAVIEWLGSGEGATALPNGTLVGWDHDEVVEQPELTSKEQEQVKSGNLKTWTVYVVYQVVSTPDVDYLVATQVNFNEEHGTQVIGRPSLEVMPPSKGAWSDAQWPKSKPASTTDIELAAKTWGNAYASGNADALIAAVADPDSKHVYAPLTGISKSETKVNRAAYLPTKEADEQPDKSVVIANVTITYTRQGQKEETHTSIDMDVRIINADSGSARVVAWGPTGTGPSLKDYSNALPGDSTGEKAEATPSPTPSAEASSGSQSGATPDPSAHPEATEPSVKGPASGGQQ